MPAILGVDYPLLFGLIVALVDALPVFGTGTILIPWSLTQFLQNDLRRGIGLLVLYGVAALSRQALEPRLVGKQVGLHPLLTLLALYTGFRAAGVAGMIPLPHWRDLPQAALGSRRTFRKSLIAHCLRVRYNTL